MPGPWVEELLEYMIEELVQIPRQEQLIDATRFALEVACRDAEAANRALVIGEDRYRKTEAISNRFSMAVATKMSVVSSDVCFLDDLLARENMDDLATDFFPEIW